MKKFKGLLSLILLLSLFGLDISFGESQEFTDVSRDSWYYDSVMALTQAGIIHGYEDGSFRPELELTNGEFLKLIVSALTREKLSSIPNRHWAQVYYNYAIDHNLLRARDISEMDLDKKINREIMSTIVLGIDLNILGGKIEELDTLKEDIKDYEEISDIRKDDLLQVYEKGYLKGKGQGRLDPKGNTTRAEASLVIGRILGKIKP